MSSVSMLKVSDNLGIGSITLPKNQEEKYAGGVNFIFSVDVSGSMYDTLKKLRTQLKNRISDMCTENDTVTIIWFSGRGQCGVLKEAAKVRDVNDLQKLHTAIDKFLQPQGLTCFADPIELTGSVIDSISKENANIFSFIFLSDGYNNDCPWQEVVTAMDKIQDRIGSATIIEYGFYADGDKLSEMAERLGGTKIVAEDFESYEPQIEKAFSSRAETLVKVDISSIKQNLINQFVFVVDKEKQKIIVCSTERRDFALVPESATEVFFITKKLGSFNDYSELTMTGSELLAATYILAERLKYDIVEELLAFIGDVKLSNLYSSSFGKQRLNLFKSTVTEMIWDETLRFSEGKSVGFVPDENAYCVLDLIDELMSSDDNLIHPYHESFNYSRTGCKSVTKKVITDEEKIKLLNAKTAKQVESTLDEIKSDIPVFEPYDRKSGYSVNNIVWNEDRANLSIQFKIPGVVKLPKNEHNLSEVDTFIFRNYTIIKDGILNFTSLPVTLASQQTEDNFKSLGILEILSDGQRILNFGHLPVINKLRVKSVYAKPLAETEIMLLYAQAARKCIAYLKQSYPQPNKNVSSVKYDKSTYDYLASIGITAYNGFSPKTERVESGDIYIATTLKTGIEKFSSLPKLEDVFKKQQDGKKLTLSEKLIEYYINNAKSETDKMILDSEKFNYLDSTFDVLNKSCKQYIRFIAQQKFALIMSRKWFRDLKQDEAIVKAEILGETVNVKFEFRDEKVKL